MGIGKSLWVLLVSFLVPTSPAEGFRPGSTDDPAIQETCERSWRLWAPIRESHPIRPQVFHPEAVLLRKGLDPQKVQFEITHWHDSKVAIKVKYADRPAGDIMLKKTVVGGRPYFEILDVRLREGMRDKGLGTELYLSAARLVDEYFKIPLISTPNTYDLTYSYWFSLGHEIKAEELWVRLVQNGAARPLYLPDGAKTQIYYVMDTPGLKAASQPAIDFFKDRLRNPQAMVLAP